MHIDNSAIARRRHRRLALPIDSHVSCYGERLIRAIAGRKGEAGRSLEPIGNVPSAEAEECYYAMMEQSEMAA